MKVAFMIATSYRGPTNNRGAVIVAEVAIADGKWCQRPRRKRLTVPYDYEVSRETRHRRAAELLAAREGLVIDHLSGEYGEGFYFSSRRA